MSTTLKLQTLVGSVASLQACATLTPADVQAYHSAGRQWALGDKTKPVSELMQAQGASPHAVSAIHFCETLAEKEAQELAQELKDELKDELKRELKGELKGEAQERVSAMIERLLS